MTSRILKRASASRPSGQWQPDCLPTRLWFGSAQDSFCGRRLYALADGKIELALRYRAELLPLRGLLVGNAKLFERSGNRLPRVSGLLADGKVVGRILEERPALTRGAPDPDAGDRRAGKPAKDGPSRGEAVGG